MRSFTQSSLPMGLLRAREAAMARFRPLLTANDVTEQQWRVLRALTSAEQPLSVGELADRTYLLGPSLSRILTHLEDQALVTRRTSPTDQRRFLLALTDEGHELVAAIAPRSEAAYNQIELDFGKQRLADLLGELAALEAVLQPDHNDERRQAVERVPTRGRRRQIADMTDTKEQT